VVEQRIEANRIEYERLLKDENYKDVKFNPNNGALIAIHKDHNFDERIGDFGIPRGDYERISAEVLYDYGRSVILESEKKPDDVRSSEGLLDGKKFEIKAVEGAGDSNILNYKMREASKQKAESIVFYYHDKNIFNKQRLSDCHERYLRTSKSQRIQTVYYILDKRLYKL
jgi:hypothetical protein